MADFDGDLFLVPDPDLLDGMLDESGTLYEFGCATGPAAIFVESVRTIRENVFRVTFNVPIYYSAILDPEDASRVDKYAATPVVGTLGLDGTAARTVSIVRADLIGDDGEVSIDGVGRMLDLILDRPMTPYPALYDVAISGVFTADLGASL